MKELKLIIDNPELERELENFGPVAFFRAPKPGERALGVMLGVLFIQDETYDRHIVLTPKLKPFPAPDWSKLGFLQPGWWVAMDEDGCFFAYEREPLLSGDGFVSPGYLHYKLHRDLFKAALPAIPTDRWREAKWQVPGGVDE